jgi:hypothetical protein
MSYNGSGTYVPPAGQPVATGTVIQSATFNTLVTDIGNTFNNVLPRDGQASMSGQLKLIDGTSSVPGIAFNSEASSGIFRPASGMLALVASGVENLRINSAGRVLIGTTTDDGTNKLQINGPTKVTGALTATSFVGPLTGNITGYKNVDNTNEMTLANGFTGGQLTMNYRGASGAITQVNVGNGIAASGVLAKIVALNIDANGNTTGNAATATNVAWTGVTGKPTTVAGYGITDAYTKAQTDAADALKANIANPSFTGIVNMNGGALELGTQGVAGAPFIDFHSSLPGSDYDARIGASGGSATPGQATISVLAATLDLTGVGTVTAASKPQGTNSTAVATTAYVDIGLSTKQANLGYTPVQQGTGIGQTTNVVKIGWSAAGALKLTVDATDLGTFAMSSGATFTGPLINTTSGSPTTAAAAITTSGGWGGGYKMIDGGTQGMQYLESGLWKWGFGTGGGITPVMTLTSSGTLSAVTITQTSDDRKKKNWKPLTDGQLDALADMKLAGTFDWIDGIGTSVGGSAQEIRAIVPEAVHEDEQGNLTVNYGGLCFAIQQAMLRRQKGAV